MIGKKQQRSGFSTDVRKSTGDASFPAYRQAGLA